MSTMIVLSRSLTRPHWRRADNHGCRRTC